MAQTCEDLITAEEKEQPTPRERQLLERIAVDLQVLGFTMGLFPDHALLIALPALLHFQMGIADPLAESVAPKLEDQLNAPALAPELPRIRPIPRPIAALDAHRARQHHRRRRQGR